jgi:adenine-specific DNA-methyltransferase
MSKKQKLELTWVGKEDRPRLEPRILIEDPGLSYHAKTRVSEDDLFDNKIIFGDNLLALKALESEYTGAVKCIFIDPPYNTGNAFENYDDGLEHSLWLSLIRDRIILLHKLLADDGFFCCQIDDGEGAYLKVLLDEIFGRANHLTTFYIQVRYGNKTLAEDNDYQKVIEQCLIYAKDRRLSKPIKSQEAYKVEKFEWEIVELAKGTELTLGGKRVHLFKPNEYKIVRVEPHHGALKETWATGSLVRQTGSSGEFLDTYLAPRKEIDGLSCLYKVHGMGEDGLGYRYMSGPKKETASKGKFYSGIPLKTLEELKAGKSDKAKPIENFYDLAGSFGNCRLEGGVDFRGGKKPEKLLEIVLQHFSSEGDLVLDSFGGSGTTAAVAHKMRRRWVIVELREQAHTHIVPRLKKVIDGSDPNGVTASTGWAGGGGFQYYRMAPSLLEKDRWGNWIVAQAYNPAMLAEAMCKLMGFTYAPSLEPEAYWQHGHSSETDFIYVTTQSLTHDALRKLSEEVGSKRTLLVCCKAFSGREASFLNLTIKKIPQVVLTKCEWGRDDYSLRVANLPVVDDEPIEAIADDAEQPPIAASRKRGRPRKADTAEASLFAELALDPEES